MPSTKLQISEITKQLNKVVNEQNDLIWFPDHFVTSTIAQSMDVPSDCINYYIKSKCKSAPCLVKSYFYSGLTLTTEAIEHMTANVLLWKICEFAVKERSQHRLALEELHTAKYYTMQQPEIKEALKKLNSG